ncbi:MAG TPA: hypothetical protein PLE36_13550 [Deltaproteobacteria bacterium]|jgi:hypothetical protein|nr:hypothetical protein [Deltaproteobacteria bacterium]HNU74565.1 hypothetical protein [Deltaproteobacteria bacterium]HOD72037.1 hypothetical protein [Deltaproteobacteria bacterium]HOE72168.1 hypothetical protein [Deltaproteobacteria bacterium]HOS26260.1 hypothetical protein [Deltaproteobacteria bacterium]
MSMYGMSMRKKVWLFLKRWFIYNETIEVGYIGAAEFAVVLRDIRIRACMTGNLSE